MNITRTQIGDAWFDTTTRRFDPDVPDDVFNEVRQNMERDGWTYLGTTGVEVKPRQLIMVQDYQQPATNLGEQ